MLIYWRLKNAWKLICIDLPLVLGLPRQVKFLLGFWELTNLDKRKQPRP